MSMMNRILLQVFKKGKRVYDKNRTADYKAQREHRDRQAALMKLPYRITVSENKLGDIRTQHIAEERNPADRIVLYIHGGGFVVGSTESRTMFTGHVADHFGINVEAVSYRLAPEYPFPAAPEDCLKAYKALLEQYESGKIILIGESAGGNLVLVLLLMIKNEGLPMPATCFALSPCVQFDRELNSYRRNWNTEGMVTNLSEEVRDVYLRSTEKADLKQPYLAPLYGDFRGCPPVYLFASESELLLDDSFLMYKKLVSDGVLTTLYLRRGMIHSWPLIPLIPEAQKDLKLIGNLMKDAFNGKFPENNQRIRLK